MGEMKKQMKINENIAKINGVSNRQCNNRNNQYQ